MKRKLLPIALASTASMAMNMIFELFYDLNIYTNNIQINKLIDADLNCFEAASLSLKSFINQHQIFLQKVNYDCASIKLFDAYKMLLPWTGHVFSNPQVCHQKLVNSNIGTRCLLGSTGLHWS